MLSESIIRRMVVVALAVLATDICYAQQVERTSEDFELGRATEILANMMREFETSYVDRVEPDRLLQSAVAHHC